jgi:DNA-directed RNA polymerase beta' subunit
MSNQDEPVDGPTGEYRKELVEEVEEVEKRKKSKGDESIDIEKETINKSRNDISEEISNDSVV